MAQSQVRFKPLQRPVFAATLSDEEEEKSIEEPVKKDVKAMKKRAIVAENEEEERRRQNFLGQIKKDKPLEPSSQQEPILQPSEGRFESNRIVVDEINQRFRAADPIHLTQNKPPASSTPYEEEMAEAWNAIDNSSRARAAFFSDPLVQFFQDVDGFIERNEFGVKKRSAGEGIQLKDMYYILAGRDAGNNQRGIGIQTLSTAPQGTGGMHGVAARPGGQDFRRKLDDSLTPDRGIYSAVRNGQNSATVNRMRNMSGYINTPVKFNLDDDDYDPLNQQSLIISPRPPVPGTPMASSTPTVNNNNSAPGSMRFYYEPSGPQMQNLPNLPDNLADPNPPQPVNPPSVPPQAQPQQNQQHGQPDGFAALTTYTNDPSYRPQVSKYLSNVRTVEAYNFMNVPEITGELQISNDIMANLRMAYNTIMLKCQRKFQGATLLDLCTKNLSNQFAHYTALWILFGRANSMNRVTLNSAPARLLEMKHSLEGVFEDYRWDNSSKTFVREPKFSNRGMQKINDPYVGMTLVGPSGMMAFNNPMFNY